MALSATQKTQYINECRDAVNTIIDGLNRLRNLRKQWDGLDMGGAGEDRLQDSDFTGDNAGITVQNLTDVMGTSLNAFESMLAAGNGTNLYRLKP